MRRAMDLQDTSISRYRCAACMLPQGSHPPWKRVEGTAGSEGMRQAEGRGDEEEAEGGEDACWLACAGVEVCSGGDAETSSALMKKGCHDTR